ncbi:MAG: 2'-5' RNA ligase family protein [Candidatus Heimdallarchaeota archaeon]
MPVAFVLAFDEKSSFYLTQISKILKKSKITFYDLKVKPHITLTSYKEIDVEIAQNRLTQFCEELEPFKIQFSSIGYFPSEESVLFLNPKANFELLNIQQNLLKHFKDYKPEFSSNEWIPHCTLAMYVSKKKISKAIDIIKNQITMTREQPFYVSTDSINIIDFKRDPLKINSIFEFKVKNIGSF